MLFLGGMEDKLKLGGRVGVYSGSFDPVHAGHIDFALTAIDRCGLDKVVFLPEEKPRNKQGVTDISCRLDMLKLVVKEHADLEVDYLPQKTFTIANTLPYIKDRYGTNIVMLVGSDVAMGFMSGWPDIDKLLYEVELAVAMRSNICEQEVVNCLDKVGFGQKYTVIHSNYSNVSSTQVRQGGEGNLYPNVANYIDSNGLYKLEK